MKPLIILLSTFTISCLSFYVVTRNPDIVMSGRIAMAMMLIFTALAHFVFIDGMTMMLPPFVPSKRFVVLFAGTSEAIAAIGLLVIYTHYIAAIALIIFFIAALPSNIYAAQKRIHLERADNNGPGLSYLWFRVPLQLFYIGWVWYFAVIN